MEPRRLATKAASRRFAEEMDFTVGKEVGYLTGDESDYNSQECLVLFVTNGVLLQLLLGVLHHPSTVG